MLDKPIVVNLLGGPGCGKSTIAAEVFSKLKQSDIECELVTEYAKDLVWSESLRTLSDQIYLFGHQFHRQWRLYGKVDVIVTDSPLLLNIYYHQKYNGDSEVFDQLVLEQFLKFDNINVMLNRDSIRYNQQGRNESEDQAREIDDTIRTLLEEYHLPYYEVYTAFHEESPSNIIIQKIINRLHERNSIN